MWLNEIIEMCLIIYKLDKYGRRIQRMEDDGTVNMRKEPRGNLERVYSYGNDEDSDATDAAVSPFQTPDLAGSRVDRVAIQSPSLASFLGKSNDRGVGTHHNHEARGVSDKAGGGGIVSVDLKELLPKQKMKFLKLDVSRYLMFHYSLPSSLSPYEIVPIYYVISPHHALVSPIWVEIWS